MADNPEREAELNFDYNALKTKKKAKPKQARKAVHVKYCPDCGLDLPISSFAPDSRRVDGVTSYCRVCIGDRTFKSSWRQKSQPARDAQIKRLARHLELLKELSVELGFDPRL